MSDKPVLDGPEKLHRLSEDDRPHPLDGPLTMAHAAMEEHLAKTVTDNFMGYQVTIRLPIVANDDPEARQITKGLLPMLPASASIKLQKIFRNRQPEAVSLE